MPSLNIGAAVGTWSASRVKNHSMDVTAIQRLLKNAADRKGNAAYNPGKLDGKIHRDSSRSATVEAIKAFQTTERNMSRPDGIVDVGEGTLAALNALFSGAPQTPTDPGTSLGVGSPRIRVERFVEHSHSIIGRLSVNGLFVCYTLEEAWRNNQRSISCVPEGTYEAFLRYTSQKSKREWCVQLENVPNRSAIQIHIGNKPEHTEGCILVGTNYSTNFVSSSTDAYQKFQDAIFGPAGLKGHTRQQIRDLSPKHGPISVQFVDPFR